MGKKKHGFAVVEWSTNGGFSSHFFQVQYFDPWMVHPPGSHTQLLYLWKKWNNLGCPDDHGHNQGFYPHNLGFNRDLSWPYGCSMKFGFPKPLISLLIMSNFGWFPGQNPVYPSKSSGTAPTPGLLGQYIQWPRLFVHHAETTSWAPCSHTAVWTTSWAKHFGFDYVSKHQENKKQSRQLQWLQVVLSSLDPWVSNLKPETHSAQSSVAAANQKLQKKL